MARSAYGHAQRANPQYRDRRVPILSNEQLVQTLSDVWKAYSHYFIVEGIHGKMMNRRIVPIVGLSTLAPKSQSCQTVPNH